MPLFDVASMSTIHLTLLHGRSLMSFTDTSMAELSQQMRKEEDMQVSARGLVPSSTRQDLAESQCFELFITKELRMVGRCKLNPVLQAPGCSA